MTTDTQLAPTDDEIHAVVQACRERGLREFDVFRAVLDKWGQPAHSGGPVAWKHDCAALLMNDVELWIDACPHCGKPRNAPQPVGREPLSDEEVDSLCKVGFVYVIDGKVTRTPTQYRDELKAAQRYGLRKGEHAHGIKGGQHGTE